MTLLCICAHCALNSKHLIITMIMATFEERCDILWKSSISGKYKQWLSTYTSAPQSDQKSVFETLSLEINHLANRAPPFNQ